ncbi:hypothetical protein ACFZB9_27990 [Kitasatospora sp. NPDC008050]|uniref:hypothetical protein n=1 Tax=Kitasatospora sp. NPDC008050 TaxID=3364021 RepID=UPI0036EA699D
MSDSPAHLDITVRPSGFAAVFHHLFTFPVVEVDDTEHRTSWGAATTLRLTPGEHRLSVYFRYRGQHAARLGEGRAVLTADGPPRLRVRAQLGVRNSSAFRITGEGVSSR